MLNDNTEKKIQYHKRKIRKKTKLTRVNSTNPLPTKWYWDRKN